VRPTREENRFGASCELNPEKLARLLAPPITMALPKSEGMDSAAPALPASDCALPSPALAGVPKEDPSPAPLPVFELRFELLLPLLLLLLLLTQLGSPDTAPVAESLDAELSCRWQLPVPA